ncbi:hypothetical protein HALO32_03187 [Halomonas lysinitropha]|uniref:Uracil-DNA glycosylase-like domain-containing protein n=1 Tax=Halomonas lysinitropha TaxID=2607506 RepID=A0A5K1I939_9GAMM|nr:hypothetical protein HALO32_03187 [Halomonas lysinitropha]
MTDNGTPFYEPWVGQSYFTSPFRNTRLLLVGESSFERDFISQPDHLSSDTQCVADGGFEPRYAGFWRFIQRSVTGEQEIRQAEQHKFWHGVSLVNWIQRPMSSKHARPTLDDYSVGCVALKSYIDELNPSGVIVFSKIAWPYLVNAFGLTSAHVPLTDDAPVSELVFASNRGYSSNVFPGGQKFLLLRHPSSRPKMSGASWAPLIHAFIKLVGHNKSLQPTSGRDAASRY